MDLIAPPLLTSKHAIRRIAIIVMVICSIPITLNLLGMDFNTAGASFDIEAAAKLSPDQQIDQMLHSLRGSYTHTLLEWSASCAAIFTAVLALVVFRIKGDLTTPIIATALFWSGCADALNILAADRLIEATANNQNLIPFTWAISRAVNALIGIVGVAVALTHLRQKKTNTFNVMVVATVSLVLTGMAYVIIHYCAVSENLPKTIYPDSFVTRPWDTIGLLLFVVNAGLFGLLYRRVGGVFAAAMLVSAIPNIATQLHMAFGSTTLFDNHFNIAHCQKVIAYLVPLAGLLVGYLAADPEAERAKRHIANVIERVTDAFVALDNDWRYTYVNEKAARIFNRQIEDLIGKHIWTEFPDGVGQPFYHAYQKAVTEQKPVQMEEYYPPWDRWFENRIYPSNDGLSIFFHDITDQKREQERLQLSEERLTLALQGAELGTWSWSVTTGQMIFDERWAQMLGYSLDEIEPHVSFWEKLIHPADMPMVREQLDAHLQGDTTHYKTEHRMRHKSGRWIWILASGKVYERDEDGIPLHAAGTHLDISRRKQEQETLTRQARDAQILHETTAIAAQTESLEDALQQCLDAICNLIGWPIGHVYKPDEDGASELISSDIWHLDHPAQFAEFQATTQQTAFSPGLGLPGCILASGKPVWIENAQEDDNFPRREAAINAGIKGAFGFPVKVGGETIAIYEFFTTHPMEPDDKLLSTVRNVGTQIGRVFERKRAAVALKQAKDKAESADHSKTEFLANMSHEIRTPMTAILGYTDLLMDYEQSDANYRKCIDTIHRNGQHLLTIINDILDLSKIESGKMFVERIECSPTQVMQDIFSLMQVRAEAKGLELRLDFQGPIPHTILSDPVRLRQILVNLVGNAIKFTEQGSVLIVAKPGDAPDAAIPHMHFQVIDTGIGMTQEQIDKIFSPFSQADTSTTRQYGGTGLGLTISRKFANLLGGQITVESTVGQRTCFTVTIPTGPQNKITKDLAPDQPHTRSENQETHPAKTTPDKPLHNTTILFAEDGLDNQELIAIFLKQWGATVSLASNGLIALELATQAINDNKPFDLIIMDVQMPEMDGLTVTRNLRKQGYKNPILALTAHAMTKDRKNCIDAGCDDFATKPIKQNQLLAFIQKHLPCHDNKD